MTRYTGRIVPQPNEAMVVDSTPILTVCWMQVGGQGFATKMGYALHGVDDETREIALGIVRAAWNAKPVGERPEECPHIGKLLRVLREGGRFSGVHELSFDPFGSIVFVDVPDDDAWLLIPTVRNTLHTVRETLRRRDEPSRFMRWIDAQNDADEPRAPKPFVIPQDDIVTSRDGPFRPLTSEERRALGLGHVASPEEEP